METLSGNIQKNREERKRIYDEWSKQDQSLSGSINTDKLRIEKLKLCIEAKSIDCEGGKKEAMRSLIPNAYADNI